MAEVIIIMSAYPEVYLDDVVENVHICLIVLLHALRLRVRFQGVAYVTAKVGIKFVAHVNYCIKEVQYCTKRA